MDESSENLMNEASRVHGKWKDILMRYGEETTMLFGYSLKNILQLVLLNYKMKGSNW